MGGRLPFGSESQASLAFGSRQNFIPVASQAYQNQLGSWGLVGRCLFGFVGAREQKSPITAIGGHRRVLFIAAPSKVLI